MSSESENPSGENGDTNALDLESVLVTTVLRLDEIDVNLYRSTHLWKPPGGRAVYGGQVVGQALVAAGKTRTTLDVHPHSLHCYFVRAGSVDKPILYHVDRVRDGISFSTRSVTATQNGEVILSMLVSYHKVERSDITYQYPFPKTPPPEELMSYDEMLRRAINSDTISDKLKERLKRMSAMEIPIDMKPVNPMTYGRFQRQPREPKSLVWVKSRGHIGTKSNNLHRCVAAYISDFALLMTSLNPFPRFRVAMAASLDHSMWFHAPFRADEWMLYECESPRSIGGRALALGRLWKRDGTLAVSVAQEGVVRGKNVPERNVTSKL